jgi:hypothetical protein
MSNLLAKLNTSIGLSYTLVGIVIGLLFYNVNPYQGWGDDYALYIHQAIAMKDGTLNQLFDANALMMSYYKLGPNLYPPAYPLFLLIPLSIFGMSIIHFKIFNLIIFCVTLLIINKILKIHHFSEGQRQLSILAITLNFNFIEFQQNLYSDIFCLFTLAFYYWSIINFRFLDTTNRLTIKHYLLILTSLALCIFSKTAYLSVIPATMAGFIFCLLFTNQSRKIVLVRGLSYCLLAGVLLMINTQYPFNGGKNEMNEFSNYSIFESIKGNLYNNSSYILQIYTKGIFEFLHFFQFGIPKNLLKLLVGLPFLVFLFSTSFIYFKKTFQEKNWKGVIVISFSFALFGLYLIWPGNQGPRFFFPLYLIIIPFSTYSLEFIPMKSSLKNGMNVLLVLVMSSFGIFTLYHDLANKQSEIKSFEDSSIVGSIDFNNCIEYLKKCQLDNRKFIGCSKARLIHLYTDKKSIVASSQNKANCQYLVLLSTHEYVTSSDLIREFSLEKKFGELYILKRKG